MVGGVSAFLVGGGALWLVDVSGFFVGGGECFFGGWGECSLVGGGECSLVGRGECSCMVGGGECRDAPFNFKCIVYRVPCFHDNYEGPHSCTLSAEALSMHTQSTHPRTQTWTMSTQPTRRAGVRVPSSCTHVPMSPEAGSGIPSHVPRYPRAPKLDQAYPVHVPTSPEAGSGIPSARTHEPGGGASVREEGAHHEQMALVGEANTAVEHVAVVQSLQHAHVAVLAVLRARGPIDLQSEHSVKAL